ncbi:MAG: [FeFe] hydrogenase H-cluster maturation GTPase HydF [Clostridiales bacterium]|nr:[FeFe] hydrogenase H-cluster maturation GTPase HydF [Clostridiales bacterium]
MSLLETPRAERLHIAIFGRRNVGKSSLINAITQQEIATVSSIKGTTTDPVYKSMELLPIGPVVLIDTAGLDDQGELGQLRMEKTLDVLKKTDLAIVVIDATEGMTKYEKEIVAKIRREKTPIIGAINKIDETKVSVQDLSNYKEDLNIPLIPISAQKGIGIEDLKRALTSASSLEKKPKKIVADLLEPEDLVVLVVPIDESAPKGRLILPQQQVIRELLDHGIVSVVTREYTLSKTLEALGHRPGLVITDSQIFRQVSQDVPEDIPLTSFSILFARYKGDLDELVKGAHAIEGLKDGDKILIAEACTHHKQDEDIGRVKIPRWIREKTGKDLIFEFTGGGDFPNELDEYALAVHCGACMLNPKAMEDRIQRAVKTRVPIVNYGVLIAYIQGILNRAVKPLLPGRGKDR